MGHELVSRPTHLKKIVAGAVAAVAVGSMPVANAAIELGEGLSVTGFVDMSLLYTDPKGAPSTRTLGIDQFETDFLYSGSGGVSAQVDIEYGDSSINGPAGGTATFVEQAFVTKKFNDMFSVKVGRFLSYSGWETEEPTGLFQYSIAGYQQYFYGFYQQGVSAYVDTGVVDVMASVVNSPFGIVDYDNKSPGYEVGAAVTPIEGLTAKAFYIVNNLPGDNDKIINVWASYAMSGFTFAGEFNTADYGNGGEGDGFLVMANYTTGPFGVTARYVDYEIENALGATTAENKSITLSPSYKVGDNLLVVAEFRSDKFGGGAKSKAVALEALFSF
jgi:hypothetical protein